MDTLLRDIRFAFRQLKRSPGFTLIACLTLGLGVGATTAIFSVVDAVLLRRLDYAAPDRLVRVYPRTSTTGEKAPQVSFPTLTDVRDQSRTLSSVGGFRYWIPTVKGRDLPETFLGVYITEGLPSTLGIAPVRGRWFQAGSDIPGKVNEAVLSDAVWRSRFGADPAVLGSSVLIEGRPTTIVGILATGFRFPDLVPDNVSIPSREPDIYLPAGQSPDDLAGRGNSNFWMVGRLAPGATLAAAQSELTTIATTLRERFPAEYQDQTFGVAPLKSEIVGSAERPLLVLLGAVGLVLLIACANVSGLLLARTASREREFALRTALGAAPLGLVRQLLTESLLLGLVGGGLGALFGGWSIDLIRALAPNTIPRIDGVTVDTRVLGFAIGISLLSGVLFGLSPALSGLRRAPASALHDGNRTSGGRAGLRRILVIAEVALSVVLLSGAGLLLRSLASVLRADAGFDGHNVLTLLTVLPSSRYGSEASQASYVRAALARLRETPDVEAAGVVNTVPLSNLGGSTWIRIPGQPEDGPPVSIPYRTVAGSYFEALRLQLATGRNFTEQDGPGAPSVAMLSETAVRQLFGDADPLGRQVQLGSDPGPRTVVGVVRDVRDVALDQPPPAMVYYPFTQKPEAVFTLVVRTGHDPRPSLLAIRRQLATLDPELAVSLIRTMDELEASTLEQRRFITVLLVGFAATALGMAAIGLYGLISYSVVQRAREIGIRLALGAAPARILRLLLREGGVLALTGGLLGLLGSFLTSRLLRGQLVGVGALDPLALGGTVVLLLPVALIATLIPARRATRADPLQALREG